MQVRWNVPGSGGVRRLHCWLTMEEDGVAMMVVGFPTSCAAAVATERECRGAREVRCIVVASKLVQPWLLREGCAAEKVSLVRVLLQRWCFAVATTVVICRFELLRLVCGAAARWCSLLQSCGRWLLWLTRCGEASRRLLLFPASFSGGRRGDGGGGCHGGWKGN